MLQALQALASRIRICRGDRSGSSRDTLVDLDPAGVYAVISATGAVADAELSARAVSEILRRSFDKTKLSFAERMVVAEEALDSILWVLMDDAQRKQAEACEISFAVILISGGWLGVLGKGSANAYLYRKDALYRLIDGDIARDTDTAIAKRITEIEPWDRFFLASNGLAHRIDEGTLASEFELSDLGIVDRITEKYAGVDDISAIAVVVESGAMS